MPIGSLVAVYFVTWWLCLFVILPFGVRTQSDSGDVVPGSDAGAPVHALLAKKLLATSILAGAVMALALWALSNPVLLEYWR